MMTYRQIRDDILRKVWIELPDIAPSYLYDDAANAVNAALQEIWLAPLLSFSKRQEETISLVAGTNRYALPSGIQTVHGAARVGNVALNKTDKRGDIEYYCRRFLGLKEEEAGHPEIYWIEQLQGASTGDAGSWLWVAPTPLANATLTIEATRDAPSVTTSTLAGSGTPPIPNRYIESLLLPVARFYMTRSHWFSHEEHRAALEADATAAMERHGLAAPWKSAAPETAAT